MKRFHEELSDDEWGGTTMKLSQVLKRSCVNRSISNGSTDKMKKSSPPPFESFSFKKDTKVGNSVIESSGKALEDDDDDFEPTRGGRQSTRGKRFIIDDSDDDDECEVITNNGTHTNSNNTESVKAPPTVVELDEEEEYNSVVEINSTVQQDFKDPEIEVIDNALYKCDQIAFELREELYGNGSSSAATCSDRYAEVESSAAKIVTQGDVDAACRGCPFEPILKPYQLVGVNFLLLLHRKKIGGAILADEMGLGKTVQAAVYLSILKHLYRDPGPHLIVCPASVLENWQRELGKWCPSLTVIQFHGTERAALSKRLNYLAKSGAPPPFNVLLVCYSMFERHSAQQKDDRKVLRRWKWSCIVMDEAHVLKDRSSYRRKNLMSVAKMAKQRLMLTGTPLQNDLEELWSLLEFMVPNIFETGDVDLKKVLTGSAEDANLITRIKSILGPFILRRLKSDVMQQLVQKCHEIECLAMTKEQADAYNEAIEQYRTASRQRLANKTSSAVGNVADFLPRRQISNYFTQFRKIANHPLLVRRLYTDIHVKSLAKILHAKGAFGSECTYDRVREELLGYNDFSLHRLSLSYGGVGSRGILDDKFAMGSAKCEILSTLLPQLRVDGHRALIFSQWTTMLDILEWVLDVIGITYRRLDGSTPVGDRQTIVDNFNNDPTIFACLLSTRAGGTGLNLTGADTVIIHDMDFNPQMDRQAEDRCHRIGQTKPVTVFRLVTKNTVDENIYEIAKRKLILDAAVLESGAAVDSNNNESDVKTMGEILAGILSSDGN